LQIRKKEMRMTPDDLSERLLQFAVRAGKVVDALPDTRMGNHVARQFVRSGTAAGPNYEEACAAESRADFAHKLSISLKELRESRSWIRLIIGAELLSTRKMAGMLDEVNQLCNIVGASLATAKGKRNKSR
jgi:four helix bundle protein